MIQDEIVCVYCKKRAELMANAGRTVVICRECGTAIEFGTYKELFDGFVSGAGDHDSQRYDQNE